MSLLGCGSPLSHVRTASSRVAAGENDDDEIKILLPTEGAAAIPLAAVRIDLFQHLTFNHDKTVGKLIVLQDIRHQSPLILSGAPRRMNTNCLSRQLPHPSLPSLVLPSLLPLLIFGGSSDSCFPALCSFLCPFPSYLPLKTVTFEPFQLRGGAKQQQQQQQRLKSDPQQEITLVD